MNRQEQAVKYVEQGLSIIPIKSKEKKPLISWIEFQKRKPTVEEVNEWFSKWPDMNIGIVTGTISGIAVVDIDSDDAFNLAQDKGVPLTPMVKTSKGYHLYFKYSDGIRNFQKRADLPGIDLRGEGGYVVAPPSEHESGHSYNWIEGFKLGTVNLSDIPEWVCAKTEAEKTPLDELYKGTTQGSRNNSLARLVGSWVNDKLNKEECLNNARLVNAKNHPPLSDSEVETIVNSIFAKHNRDSQSKVVDTIEAVDTFSSVPIVEFDLNVFPEEIKTLIQRVAKAFNINYEPVATIMLSILSSAVGNTIRVSPKLGWNEPVFIWSMVTGPSGSGKTPFSSLLLKSVNDLQQLANLNQGNNTIFGDDGLEIQLQPKYLVSDTTIEALSEALRQSARGLLCYHDELAGFIKMQDKYSKGNERQKYLELWSCQPWKVDRIGRGSFFIQDTGLSICGGIQLSIIPDVFGKLSIDDGLLPRFLFTSVEEQDYSKDSILPEDAKSWYDLVWNCHRIPLVKNKNGVVEHTILQLSEEAHELFSQVQSRYKKEAHYSPYSSLRVFVPKLFAYVLRIAGILHILEYKCLEQSVISAGTIQKSIRLVDYYMNQAIRILAIYQLKKDSSKRQFTETQQLLIRVLKRIESSVRHGKIITSKIAQEFNENCPESMRLNEQRIAYELIGLGFQTKQSSGVSHLLWEPTKVNLLHSLV